MSSPIGRPIPSAVGGLPGDCQTAASAICDDRPIVKRGCPSRLDAAANRAREGLRVVEDYVRFVLDDRHLTELCKQLRHDLTAAAVADFDRQPNGRPRNARGRRHGADHVGRTAAARMSTSVVRANFARLQESLRSLEEFGKLAKLESG